MQVLHHFQRLLTTDSFRRLKPKSALRPPLEESSVGSRELLDLSLRNRLLNFRPSKQTVPILCPNVSRLEDRLADGAGMRVISLNDGNPLGHAMRNFIKAHSERP